MCGAPTIEPFGSLSDTQDSTGSNNNLTAANVTVGTGALGGHAVLDGQAGELDANARGSLNGLFNQGGTIVAVIQPQGWGQNDFGRIVDRSVDNNALNGWALQLDNGAGAPRRTLRFERGGEDARGAWELLTDSIALDVRQVVALVYDDSDPANVPRMFLDGVEQTVLEQEAVEGAIQNDNGRRCYVGNSAEGDRTFDGILDEIRLSNVPRSAEWIEAQFLSLTEQLLDIGSEELAP